MRVLHFYKTYKPDTVGGVENFIGELCSGAARNGVESTVLTVSSTPTPVDLGDHIHYRAKSNFTIASTPFSVAAFGEFQRLAKNADLIHYHFPWPFMDIVHFATRLEQPTLVTYHSDIVKQRGLLSLYRPLMLGFLKSVTSIVATSENYKQSSNVLSRFAGKTEVIPIGINRAAYPEVAADVLHRWSTRVGTKFFLFVGNLRYYKGLHNLIAAAHGTEIRVVIAGAGPLEEELKRQALVAGTNNITFTGLISDTDKHALLTLCYGLAFPSQLRSEAFGISLLEGAMYGKPMVSCEIGTGTSYVNATGITGLVVPPNDVASLREALVRLWRDEALASDFGRAAKKRYAQLFTSDLMIQRYMELYLRLVGR